MYLWVTKLAAHKARTRFYPWMCCSDTFKLQTSRCIAKGGWMATSAWEQCKVCFSMHFRQTLLECSQLRNNVTFSSDNQFQGSVKTPLHGIYNWRPVGFLCVPYMGTTSSYNCFPSWIAKSELVLCSNTELNVTPRVSSFHIWKAGSVMKPPRHSMANNTVRIPGWLWLWHNRSIWQLRNENRLGQLFPHISEWTAVTPGCFRPS